jgi:hypothetical protein
MIGENDPIRVPLAVEAVTGERACPRKCWRWQTKGIRGRKLHTWLRGAQRVTTVALVREFLEPGSTTNFVVPRPMKTTKAQKEFLTRELGCKFED